MNSLFRNIVVIPTLVLLWGTSSAFPAAPRQNGPGANIEGNISLPRESVALSKQSLSELLPLSANLVSPNADEVIVRLLLQNQLRDAQLKRYSVVRTYEVRNRNGKLSAQEVVRMEYVAPDKKTFQKTSEEGSGVVRHMVFDRLMKSEIETASGKEHHDSALSPSNYTFIGVGEENVGPYHCYVIRAIPKRKDKYLFEGTVWIDTQDFAVVKIAGHPAKKLSFWIERADFERQYQKIGEFWLPYRDETIVHVRWFGEKRFTIDHYHYSISSSGSPMDDSADVRTAQ